MRIAFLGTGRMGTELALHLLPDHELTVWNRTASRTQRLAEAGAAVAGTAAEAVAGAELVVTSLFGPDAVRETVIVPSLIPGGVTWVDTTTVSPADAEGFADAVPSYVGAPVVGTLGPARNGSLGVYVGSPDDGRREQVLELVAPWADPERLRGVGSGRAMPPWSASPPSITTSRASAGWSRRPPPARPPARRHRRRDRRARCPGCGACTARGPWSARRAVPRRAPGGRAGPRDEGGALADRG